MKENTFFEGDVCEVKTSRKMIKKLEKTIELRILDLKGKKIMTFWKQDARNIGSKT